MWSAVDPLGHVGHYAPAALGALLQANPLILFGTPEASARHLNNLRAELDPGITLEIVTIPSGQNEDELWEIFNLITHHVEPGEEIAIDVTHGFRSLPLVGLLAAELLRTARQIHIKHLLYCAWEASDKSVSPPVTPVFDLSPMLSLLEWADAADRFIRNGDAQDLSAQLSAASPPYTRRQASKKADDTAKSMHRTAGQLSELADAISLVRTYAVFEQAANVGTRLDELVTSDAAAPFLQVLEPIRQMSASLALTEPDNSPRESLERQRSLIIWYVEHGQYVQAATLGREWLVSWLMVQRGKLALRDKALRDAAEEELNSLCRVRNGVMASLACVPAELDLPGWWHKLAQETRNDIDHAGMRKEVKSAGTLIKTITAFASAIRSWPLSTP